MQDTYYDGSFGINIYCCPLLAVICSGAALAGFPIVIGENVVGVDKESIYKEP